MLEKKWHIEKLLQKCTVKEVKGSVDVEIYDLCFDSRKAGKGSLFFAIRGSEADGHSFIDKAISQGATAVVCEALPKICAKDVTYMRVENSSFALGQAACIYYGNPSEELTLIGVTGTNGKTTIATLLYHLFKKLGYKVGLLSTIENRVIDDVIQSTHTTGDAIEINDLLRTMVDRGCKYVFMEVSSHAIVQERIAGLRFRGGIFTNITRDHLDYHKTFKDYIIAKKKFFDNLPSGAFAIINIDDENGRVMVQNTAAKVMTYSLSKMADFKTKIVESSLDGLWLDLGGIEVHTLLVGKFNAYNFTAIYATACMCREEKVDVLCAMSTLEAADGRFELVKGVSQNAIVDYAHTPDALENVLSTLTKMRKKEKKIICVFGCGGNRDHGKRPIMAEVACKYADTIILTSDNPRLEDPQSIIDQIYEGVKEESQSKCLKILLREEAIKTACAIATKEDVLLVAGKGHETYQEIQGVKHHFDDREMLKKYLK